jgi:hypothetical protein
LIWTGASRAAEIVVINLMVVNGAAQPKDFPVRYALPGGIKPANIIETAGLKVDYDVQQDVYYLTGTAALGPKESRTLRVEVEDVWRVDPGEIAILKQQLSDNLELLQNTEFYEGAELLHDQMTARLDYILARQDQYEDNIERRIEQYESSKGVLDDIRSSAFSLDYLRRQAKLVDLAQEETMQFVIEVENPQLQPKEIVHQHYLPAEITPSDVIDAQGFEVRYDKNKEQNYLGKEETLQPGEKKRYEVMVRDVWKISPALLTDLETRAGSVFRELKGTLYEDSADFLFTSITVALEEIQRSSGNKDDIKGYIGAFRANQRQLKQVKDDIQKLEGMLAVVNAQRLAELKGDGGGMLQRLRSLSGISTVSVAIFGSTPSLTMTWKIILGIMVFLALFTAVHFLTWWKRSEVMGEGAGIKPGGSFTHKKE